MLMHLPVLQVVVPLLAAPACLLLRRARAAWLLALLACGAACAISVALLLQTADPGASGYALSYALGGWEAPWGIEYRVDPLNAYVMVLVSAMATLMLVGAQVSIGHELPENQQLYFYIAYLLCVSGLLGIAATGDIFNVFVFLEISALSSYILIALSRSRAALWASFQYLIMGSIGATFVLIGIGLLYVMTGTLNMQDLAQRLPQLAGSRTVLTALVFLVTGVGLKLALYPVHTWLPSAYACAPSIVTAFLASTATKVAVYLLIRILFDVFGAEFAYSRFPLQPVLLSLGIAGVLVASVAAIRQSNVKRLLAYSSVAQIGYIVLGIGILGAAGLTAALLHLFNHALMKGALFLALAAVAYRAGGVELKDFAGIGRRMPYTTAAIAVGGLSLIGVPLTAGFVSKWYLAVAALEQGWWWLVGIVLIGSLLAVVYVWRIVEAAYFGAPEGESEGGGARIREAPWSLLLPVWLLALANVYFGIDTRFTVGFSRLIAHQLFGAAP
jgi:multicomponent Na+:H+ antiporter subunit D